MIAYTVHLESGTAIVMAGYAGYNSDPTTTYARWIRYMDSLQLETIAQADAEEAYCDIKEPIQYGLQFCGPLGTYPPHAPNIGGLLIAAASGEG